MPFTDYDNLAQSSTTPNSAIGGKSFGDGSFGYDGRFLSMNCLSNNLEVGDLVGLGKSPN